MLQGGAVGYAVGADEGEPGVYGAVVVGASVGMTQIPQSTSFPAAAVVMHFRHHVVQVPLYAIAVHPASRVQRSAHSANVLGDLARVPQ